MPKLLEAINNATHIDFAVAFIRQTGLKLIYEALEDALSRKVKIRILTGDYLGITDPIALKNLLLLKDIGEADVDLRVFNSLDKNSFHMKAYLFIGKENEGCAFIGSSNITRSALQTGLEWNLFISENENNNRFTEIKNNFSKIYADKRVSLLTNSWITNYQLKLTENEIKNETNLDEADIQAPPTPNEIQVEALAELKKTREAGYKRGLVVMATGTGKTWLSAFDTKALNAKKILFVAHREEILTQAKQTFIQVHPDLSVGLYIGDTKNLDTDLLFGSIQTIGKTNHLLKFDPTYFDYIVIDEFHHASAGSYRKLLNYFKPSFLLGLTATPNRTDQSDILSLCDDNLVYSKDLFDAIKLNILCPFTYYGIADETVNYEEIPWRNGKFDSEALINQLATNARAMHIYKVWREKAKKRTIGFCVSTAHCDFMSEFFQRQGVKAVSVHSKSTVRRNEAIQKLQDNEIEVLFSVDLFNEGVDIPGIDTALMIRPTESKIIFLQQLGRGLRKSQETEKTNLVVLDFIGNHRSFFKKLEALFRFGTSNSERREFLKELSNENLELPAGCYANIDLKIIDFLSRLIQNRLSDQEDLYQNLKDSLDRRPTITEFFRAGGALQTVKNAYESWFEFVSKQNDLTDAETKCMESHKDLLLEIEVTKMTKSYKLFLLEAFLNIEGFQSAPSITALSLEAFALYKRRPLLIGDLPVEFQNSDLTTEQEQKKWKQHWLKFPIKYLTGGDSKTNKSFFEVKEDRFHCKENITDKNNDTLVSMIQELLDLRFEQYQRRNQTKPSETQQTEVTEEEYTITIPFFSDLKIACGHFRTSEHKDENIETIFLSNTFGKLNPSKHFIARAKGNSMNGGKNPIKDGDYLLLELITSNSAGSISNQIIAIEQQDLTGDDQYLLRYIKKNAPGNYTLLANNPNYEPMPATENMNTFARLKAIIPPNQIQKN